MIKGVIFDQDGLMFDTERVLKKAWEKAGRDWNILIEEDFLKTIRGMKHQDARVKFEARYGTEIDFLALRNRRQEYFEEFLRQDGVAVKPGLVELLSYLKEEKIPAAVASASPMEYTKRNLTETGISQYFSQLVTGDMVAHAKPDPEIFQKAAELLGLKPEQCLVLEDSLNGVEAGIRGGFITVMVPDMTMPDPALAGRVKKVCSSLLEVRDMLKEERT